MEKLISTCLLTLSLAISQASCGEKTENFLTEVGHVAWGFTKSLVLKTHTPSGKIIEPMFPLEDAYHTCVKHPGKTLLGVSAAALFPVYQGVAPVAIGASSAISSGKDFVRSFASKKFSGPEKAFYSSIALLSMISSAYGAVEGIQTYCSGEECSSVNLCPMPEGSFRASCNGTSTLHVSSDPNVGHYCEYNGKCLPPIVGEPLVENQFFYPAGGAALQDLDNINGVISSTAISSLNHASTISSQIDGSPIENSSKSRHCKEIGGSFFETCQVTTEDYQSSDPVVRGQDVPLCEIHSSCVDVDGKEVVHSQVFLHEERVGLPLENCDGYPVQHSGGQDTMCQNSDGSIAKEIGMASRIGKVLGRTKRFSNE